MSDQREHNVQSDRLSTLPEGFPYPWAYIAQRGPDNLGLGCNEHGPIAGGYPLAELREEAKQHDTLLHSCRPMLPCTLEPVIPTDTEGPHMPWARFERNSANYWTLVCSEHGSFLGGTLQHCRVQAYEHHRGNHADDKTCTTCGCPLVEIDDHGSRRRLHNPGDADRKAWAVEIHSRTPQTLHRSDFTEQGGTLHQPEENPVAQGTTAIQGSKAPDAPMSFAEQQEEINRYASMEGAELRAHLQRAPLSQILTLLDQTELVGNEHAERRQRAADLEGAVRSVLADASRYGLADQVAPGR